MVHIHKRLFSKATEIISRVFKGISPVDDVKIYSSSPRTAKIPQETRVHLNKLFSNSRSEAQKQNTNQIVTDGGDWVAGVGGSGGGGGGGGDMEPQHHAPPLRAPHRFKDHLC